MKSKYILPFLYIFFLISSLKISAQYRQYENVQHDKNGDPISSTSKTTVEEPFNFRITFDNMNVLLNMQNAIAIAQKAAVDRWMSEQENIFKNEINRQLGTKHTSFLEAQKDFFKNYEKNFLRVEEIARQLGTSHSNKAKTLDTEQTKFTEDLYVIDDWRIMRNNCLNSGTCSRYMANKIIRGTRLLTASVTTINKLYDETLVDFSNREYDSALNLSWSQGINTVVNGGTLPTEMMNKHIGYYNQRSLKDKIFLMTAYLTQYNKRSSGPLTVPIPTYAIPQFWNNTTLLEMGKKKAPALSERQTIFKPNFFELEAERCNYMSSSTNAAICRANWERLAKLKKDILKEHTDLFLNYSELGMTQKLERIRQNDPVLIKNWPGKLGGLDALAYKNYHLDGSGSNPNRFYELNNGGWVYRSSSARDVNGGKKLFSSEPSLNRDGYFYYIYNEETKSWHELLMPATGVSTTSDPYLVTAFWQGMKGIARYALPIEDAIILVDGKDFDSNQASQAEAGVFLVAGFVPGGKILKPVFKASSKASKIILKIGTKTIIQTATLIEDFITVFPRVNLPTNITATFLNGGYRTVKNNVDLNLYRSFGKPKGSTSIFASIDGAYVTTKKGATRNELALIKDFNNSMQFEAKIKVPAGQTINIGKVGPQKSLDGLQNLQGGGDQVLLPSNWNLEWVIEIIDNTNGRKYTLEEFRRLFPELFKR